MKLNALPYLMYGEVVQDTTPKVMEFKSRIMTPVRTVKPSRVASPKPVITGSGVSKFKFKDPKKVSELVSKEEIDRIPIVNLNKKLATVNEVAEVSIPLIPGVNQENKSLVQLEFNQDNVRKVLDHTAAYLAKELNKKSAGALIKHTHFALKDNIIIFDFSSTIEETQFKEALSIIGNRLKSPFLPTDVQFESYVTITEGKAKEIFSPNAKLAKMIAKSEGVKKLADAFNLGIKS